MQFAVDSGELDYSWGLMITRFSETGVSLLLYGSYIPFFLIAAYTLSRRWKNPGIKLLMIASCLMAVLGTIQLGVNVAITVATARFFQQVIRAQILNEPDFLYPLTTIQNFTFVTNVFVTDSFLLYRCYVIWAFQRKILVLPVLLMVSTFVSASVAFSGFGDLRIPYDLAAATNLVLTASIAGRIMWIRRAASLVGLDDTLRGRYSLAIRIILESGVIYAIATTAMIVIVSVDDFRVYNIGVGVAGQLMNIIPTFTLMYVGLNNTVERGPTQSTRGTPSNQDSRIRLSARALDSWRESDIIVIGRNREQDCGGV
ncbi:MYND-type domain-containing protein [Mycena venus]|uniref:MYND-type domain-containing protein n=1 Tax=Mycena venus TaxID=2733690 RepID=A0A8H6X2T2_9AGAR|nr:MYND-type domain-containing protein [Mycena venus]